LFSDRYLLAAAFLLGLGLGNHMTLAFLAPPSLLLIASKWSKRSLITLPATLGAFLLGLAIYVYLPISAAQDPVVNWGEADRLSGFWWTVSGTPYRQFAFGATRELWIDNLWESLRLLVDQFYYPGVAIGLVGAAFLWRRHTLSGVFGVSYVLLILLYATTYSTPDAFVYLIPTFMVFALWVGLGSYWALTEAIPWLLRQRQAIRYQGAYGPALALVAALMIALVPGRSLAVNYSDQDLSDDSTAVAYGQHVAETVEPGSLILADLDPHIFSLWYTTFVTESQPEVILITQNLLQYDWYTESLKERYPGIMPAAPGGTFQERLPNLIRVNLHKRPIYITDRTPSNNFIFQQFETEPMSIGDSEGRILYLVRGE
ncbi:MAG: hypothetical protein ACE5JL_16920, partial [Dehalococcoidia bacterium]